VSHTQAMSVIDRLAGASMDPAPVLVSHVDVDPETLAVVPVASVAGPAGDPDDDDDDWDSGNSESSGTTHVSETDESAPEDVEDEPVDGDDDGDDDGGDGSEDDSPSVISVTHVSTSNSVVFDFSSLRPILFAILFVLSLIALVLFILAFRGVVVPPWIFAALHTDGPDGGCPACD
jgi:hypothetical protein